MKFDQKTIVTLLIGILIGGVGVGLIDANRPQPLFSSADSGIGICARLYGEGWKDNGITASGFLICSKKGEQDRYVNLRPDTGDEPPMLE